MIIFYVSDKLNRPDMGYFGRPGTETVFFCCKIDPEVNSLLNNTAEPQTLDAQLCKTSLAELGIWGVLRK